MQQRFNKPPCCCLLCIKDKKDTYTGMCKVPRAFYKVQYYAAPSVSAISLVTYKWGGPVRQVDVNCSYAASCASQIPRFRYTNDPTLARLCYVYIFLCAYALVYPKLIDTLLLLLLAVHFVMFNGPYCTLRVVVVWTLNIMHNHFGSWS
jgi:hypothetical protein